VGLSVRLWQQKWPSARIVAVEPDAENYRVCMANIAAGPAPRNVRCFLAAAVGSSRTLYLDRSASEYSFRTTDSKPQLGSEVSGMTIPDLLSAADLASSRIDLLKCDIEGGEKELFANCIRWLPRVVDLIVELHPGYSRENLLRDLERAGGDFEIYFEETKGTDIAVLFLRNKCAPSPGT
jgi:FkbM family methyltransferase